MITLNKLPQFAIDVLTRRITDEQNEFSFYVSAAGWCRLNGYQYSANFFQVESSGEEYHYKRLMTFLSDWNSQTDFKPMVYPPPFVSLQDIFEKAYQMEYDLYLKYQQDCVDMFSKCQNAYMLLQEFVSMQNRAVVQASSYLIKMQKYIDDGDNSLINFDKEVFSDYGYLGY